MGLRALLILPLLLSAACTVPGLDLEGKTCTVADPCPSPYRCASGACTRNAAASDVKVVAAGAIACSPADVGFGGGDGTGSACRMRATAARVMAERPDAVLVLGDAQFADGSLAEYRASYDLGWGPFKDITHPAIGTHDYFSGAGLGYFAYFGASAGPVSRGYDSFELGAWHLVALNSECDQVGGCGPGSEQEAWLRADLAAHPSRCTLAFWSKPRFSAAGGTPAMSGLWKALEDAHADLALTGGSRFYERLAPLDSEGGVDPEHGIRTLNAGTGGIGGFQGADHPLEATEAIDADTLGVLVLTLHEDGYDFEFVPVAPGVFTDQGSGTCH